MELAVLIPLNKTEDKVITFPEHYIKSKKAIEHPDFPFSIQPIGYFPNSKVGSLPENIKSVASKGLGTLLMVSPLEKTYNDKEKNMPSAYIELKNGKESLGVWLVSNLLSVEQSIEVNGKNYRFILRPKRYYLGYSLTLIDFTHDKYIGTGIPKNFSSKVRLYDQDKQPIQDALIYMNHPLRYSGKTFYQASFGKNDTLSVLQVVENPGWLLPYIASIIMGLGLLIHFGIHLRHYLSRRRS